MREAVDAGEGQSVEDLVTPWSVWSRQTHLHRYAELHKSRIHLLLLVNGKLEESFDSESLFTNWRHISKGKYHPNWIFKRSTGLRNPSREHNECDMV